MKTKKLKIMDYENFLPTCQRFYKRFVEDKSLKRLDNGFVIFTPYPFEIIKSKIDSVG